MLVKRDLAGNQKLCIASQKKKSLDESQINVRRDLAGSQMLHKKKKKAQGPYHLLCKQKKKILIDQSTLFSMACLSLV